MQGGTSPPTHPLPVDPVEADIAASLGESSQQEAAELSAHTRPRGAVAPHETAPTAPRPLATAARPAFAPTAIRVQRQPIARPPQLRKPAQGGISAGAEAAAKMRLRDAAPEPTPQTSDDYEAFMATMRELGAT